MMHKKIFAVVDIETTGTDPEIDRIIQFGCAFIQDGKIISQVAMDINPGRQIPKLIQQLTGITNAQVKQAPYFEDVAWTITNLLADTIFVAHNIHFDYAFLSKELKRCGAPELTIPGIDTVELAQIFFPQERSYRLSDLAKQFGLTHLRPHQADSDAEVTAALFLRIEEKIRQVPLVTLAQIVALSQHTARNTATYLQQRLTEMKQMPLPLAANVQVVDGLALRKKTYTVYEATEEAQLVYPKNKREKEKLYAKKFQYRPEQSRMMNAVYTHFTAGKKKNLFLEAATGIGKTLGYLLPLSYLATPERPVILSTVSMLLQEQLLTKEVAQANQVCPQPFQAVIIKSHRHYLDLQRFQATLSQPVSQKQYALYQMRVLVWLLETTTGDVNELHLANYEHVFWQDVTHRGLDFLSQENPLYAEDFLRFLYEKAKQSNLWIVNHAFLVQETARTYSLLPEKAYLVIDEAHHLPDYARQVAAQTFHVQRFKKEVHTFLDQTLPQVKKLLQQQNLVFQQIGLYEYAMKELLEALSFFFEAFHQIPLFALTSETSELFLQTDEALADLSVEGQKALTAILALLADLRQMNDWLQASAYQKIEQFLQAERRLFMRADQFFAEFAAFQQVFSLYFQDWQPRWVKSIVFPAKKSEYFALHDLDAAQIAKSVWYLRYPHILFTGGTLALGTNRHYLPETFGVTDYTFTVLRDPYDYGKQARLLVPTEALNMKTASQDTQTQFITQVICQLMTQESRTMMVLFTSLEMVKQVYEQLSGLNLANERELLAQGVSGSRERILKRFYQSDRAVLLGAMSFWEGIDLPGQALQLIIITRLPFDNPQQPYVRANANYLTAKGLQPFAHDMLPKAALRMRQALGRLIRAKTDRGILICLDRRLLHAGYSKRLLAALPKTLPITEVSLAVLGQEVAAFFQAKTKENPKNEEKS